MRSAVIDIGTNSVLLLIGEITSAGDINVILDEARITRLGEHLKKTHIISQPALERTLIVLREYIKICRDLKVSSIHLIGTEVFRSAENSPKVLSAIRNVTGLTVKILTITEEATYSFHSAVPSSLNKDEQFLVADVGGGSTEIVYGNSMEIQFIRSLPVGSVVLFERYFSHDPPSLEEMNLLQADLKIQLTAVPQTSPISDITGIGGTITTLAAIKHSLTVFDRTRIEGTCLYLEELFDFQKQFTHIPSGERAQIPGMEQRREDIIIAGTAIIIELLEYFHLSRICVCTKGVRYGFLKQIGQSKE
jgi:exopolyphosphatase/guanosine-5'-triphosphate,3'-diphosphate pyrophosphatase